MGGGARTLSKDGGAGPKALRIGVELMPQTDIVGALRFSAEIVPDGFPETMQWGVHTGNRDSDDFPALLDVFVTQMMALSGVLAPAHWTRWVISRWASGPSFVGWHQEFAQPVNEATGTGSMLPHQLSVVVGYNNLTEGDVALGRRRNRSNIGPLNAATMDTSGRTTTTVNSTLGDIFSALDGGWSAIDSVIPNIIELQGMCVASPTEGVLMEANQLRVGRRYDILRSRAEKTPETPTLIDLEG